MSAFCGDFFQSFGGPFLSTFSVKHTTTNVGTVNIPNTDPGKIGSPKNDERRCLSSPFAFAVQNSKHNKTNISYFLFFPKDIIHTSKSSSLHSHYLSIHYHCSCCDSWYGVHSEGEGLLKTK